MRAERREIEVVEHGDRVDVTWGDLTLASCVHRPAALPSECPKPFVHPLRTLDGDAVTAVRPSDHRWHTGLFLGYPNVGGDDFWGGPTWVPDAGWVQLDNVGSIAHRRWVAIEASGDSARLDESLEWRSRSGAVSLSERRRIEVGDVDPDAGVWRLGIESTLVNETDRELGFTTPASRGLPGYGYGGWTWRGIREFREAEVFTPDASGEAAVHGSPTPWLAVAGEHDEHDRCSTVVFVDRVARPGSAAAWAVWLEYVMVCRAELFDRDRTLAPGASFTHGLDVLVATGRRGRDDVVALVARSARPRSKDAR